MASTTRGDPFPLLHLSDLDFPLSLDSLPSLPSVHLALAHLHIDWDDLLLSSPSLPLKLKTTWRKRREKARKDISSHAPRGVYAPQHDKDREQTPYARFELIDLGFEVREGALEGLTSAQLAAVPFHPAATEGLVEEANDIFFNRRERDFNLGLTVPSISSPPPQTSAAAPPPAAAPPAPTSAPASAPAPAPAHVSRLPAHRPPPPPPAAHRSPPPSSSTSTSLARTTSDDGPLPFSLPGLGSSRPSASGASRLPSGTAARTAGGSTSDKAAEEEKVRLLKERERETSRRLREAKEERERRERYEDDERRDRDRARERERERRVSRDGSGSKGGEDEYEREREKARIRNKERQEEFERRRMAQQRGETIDRDRKGGDERSSDGRRETRSRSRSPRRASASTSSHATTSRLPDVVLSDRKRPAEDDLSARLREEALRTRSSRSRQSSPHPPSTSTSGESSLRASIRRRIDSPPPPSTSSSSVKPSTTTLSLPTGTSRLPPRPPAPVERSPPPPPLPPLSSRPRRNSTPPPSLPHPDDFIPMSLQSTLHTLFLRHFPRSTTPADVSAFIRSLFPAPSSSSSSSAAAAPEPLGIKLTYKRVTGPNGDNVEGQMCFVTFGTREEAEKVLRGLGGREGRKWEGWSITGSPARDVGKAQWRWSHFPTSFVESHHSRLLALHKTRHDPKPPAPPPPPPASVAPPPRRRATPPPLTTSNYAPPPGVSDVNASVRPPRRGSFTSDNTSVSGGGGGGGRAAELEEENRKDERKRGPHVDRVLQDLMFTLRIENLPDRATLNECREFFDSEGLSGLSLSLSPPHSLSSSFSRPCVWLAFEDRWKRDECKRGLNGAKFPGGHMKLWNETGEERGSKTGERHDWLWSEMSKDYRTRYAEQYKRALATAGGGGSHPMSPALSRTSEQPPHPHLPPPQPHYVDYERDRTTDLIAGSGGDVSMAFTPSAAYQAASSLSTAPPLPPPQFSSPFVSAASYDLQRRPGPSPSMAPPSYPLYHPPPPSSSSYPHAQAQPQPPYPHHHLTSSSSSSEGYSPAQPTLGLGAFPPPSPSSHPHAYPPRPQASFIDGQYGTPWRPAGVAPPPHASQQQQHFAVQSAAAHAHQAAGGGGGVYPLPSSPTGMMPSGSSGGVAAGASAAAGGIHPSRLALLAAALPPTGPASDRAGEDVMMSNGTSGGEVKTEERLDAATEKKLVEETQRSAWDARGGSASASLPPQAPPAAFSPTAIKKEYSPSSTSSSDPRRRPSATSPTLSSSATLVPASYPSPQESRTPSLSIKGANGGGGRDPSPPTGPSPAASSSSVGPPPGAPTGPSAPAAGQASLASRTSALAQIGGAGAGAGAGAASAPTPASLQSLAQRLGIVPSGGGVGYGIASGSGSPPPPASASAGSGTETGLENGSTDVSAGAGAGAVKHESPAVEQRQQQDSNSNSNTNADSTTATSPSDTPPLVIVALPPTPAIPALAPPTCAPQAPTSASGSTPPPSPTPFAPSSSTTAPSTTSTAPSAPPTDGLTAGQRLKLEEKQRFAEMKRKKAEAAAAAAAAAGGGAV